MCFFSASLVGDKLCDCGFQGLAEYPVEECIHIINLVIGHGVDEALQNIL